jgi:hypothetical protein
MIKLKRFLLIGAAAVAVGVQGCGCDGSKKRYSTSPSTPPPESTVRIQGTAGKGILQNFTATAHILSNSYTTTPGAPIATGLTQDDGTYRLEIPRQNIGSPIIIKVAPTSDSTMICDLPQGCGDNEFGEPTPVDDDFQLSVVVPDVSDNQNVNLSAFTTIATSLVLDKAGSGDDLDTIRRYIAESNSQVANRFGLSSDLGGLPVIDITKPNQANTIQALSDRETARYNALNSGLLSAVMNDNPESKMGSALNQFISDYVERGVAGNTNNDSDTSFAEIVRQAAEALRIVGERAGESSNLNLRPLTQELDTEADLASNEEPDEFYQGTPSDTDVNASARDKAIAMVTDLRNLIFSFGEQSIKGGTIGAIADDFALQIEGAEMASSRDAGSIVEALVLAASALDDANRAYQANNALTSYLSDTGITVSIEAGDDAVAFEIDQTVTVASSVSINAGSVGTTGSDGSTAPSNPAVKVTLSSTNALEVHDGATADSASGEYSVSGSAETGDLKLTISQGSFSVNYEGSKAGASEAHELSNLQLRLAATLTQKDVQLPIVLTGRLEVTVRNVELESTAAAGGESTEASIGAIAFSFNGSVDNSADETAQFALALSGDAKGMSLTEAWVNGTKSVTTETEEQFADAFGSLHFTAKLTGIPNAVVISFSATRTALEAAATSLNVRYSGKQFRFSMDVEEGEPKGYLTITNQDGVIMRLRQVKTGSKLVAEGDVTYQGVVHGVIEERSGQVVVRFAGDNSDELETLY